MSEQFAEWLKREMPAGTVISDPEWWAPRILKAARAAPAEPVAWMNFDGEGNYDFTDDEETAKAWERSNGEPYKSWLKPLYTAPDALQAEVERLKHFEAAYKEWSDKTDWVQESAEVRELGKHRADVMRERIARLQEEKDSAIRILARQIDKFRAALIERDAFKADAERYQYLKYILDDSPYYIQILEHTEGDLLDEAIDNSRRDHPDFKPEVDHE